MGICVLKSEKVMHINYIFVFLMFMGLGATNISDETKLKERLALDKLVRRYCKYEEYKRDKICIRYFKSKKEGKLINWPL